MLNLLCWSAYMDNMVEKATERMYFIKQVKKQDFPETICFILQHGHTISTRTLCSGVAICIDCSVLCLIKSVVSCR